MSSIIDIQDALIETLQDMTRDGGMPLFTQVESWTASGAAAIEQNKSIKPPAAFVVFLSASELDAPSETTKWGVFVITGGVMGKDKRNREAIETVERVVAALRNHRLGLKKVSAVKSLSIETLYSEPLDRNGLGLFGLSFELKRHG